MRSWSSVISRWCLRATVLGVVAAACVADDEVKTALGNGPDSAHKSSLLKEIDRALLLIEKEEFEQLVEDYYPYETYRDLRQQTKVKSFAAELKESKSDLKHLQDRLKACRSAKLMGNNDEVAFLPFEDEAAKTRLESAPLPQPPQVEGYGDDFKTAINRAIEDLKVGKHQEFLTRMLPLPVLQTLSEQETLSMAAEQYAINPLMTKLMVSDLQAISKLSVQPDRNLVQLTLPGRNRSESKREIRFQLVGGSWRFFDRATEIRIQQNDVMANGEAPRDLEAETILKFERLRDHWRLSKLPEQAYGVPGQPFGEKE